jgi:hypothetical protein
MWLKRWRILADRTCVTASLHARGIVIAGALAALALALGFVTLAMNQTASQAAPNKIIPLKDRHHLSAFKAVKKTTPVIKKKKVAVKRPNPNFVAALKAGLPRVLAKALAKRSVVVVELWSSSDPVGTLSAGEAKVGSTRAGAGFVGIDVDTDGVVGKLTEALGKVPVAPAVLVYTRPATLSLTLPGFNDRTAVEQAAEQAAALPQDGSSTASDGSTDPTQTSAADAQAND